MPLHHPAKLASFCNPARGGPPAALSKIGFVLKTPFRDTILWPVTPRRRSILSQSPVLFDIVNRTQKTAVIWQPLIYIPSMERKVSGEFNERP